jgi:chromosome segregation ATPase
MSVSTNYTETSLSPNTEGGALATRNIEVITSEIHFYKKQAGEAILEIGSRLNEAKSQLEHGEWLDWLGEKVDFSEASAQRLMRLAREYSDPSLVTELGSSKALAMLALPPADREEFLNETHTVDGEEKTVSDMSKRELEAAVKERAEAIKAKEAAEKIAKDAEAELLALQAKLKEAESRADEAENATKAAETDKATAAAELDNLQKADIQLPDEEGQQMMEDLRKQIAAEAKKEAEEKLKKKIEKADAEKAAAESKLKDAEDAKVRLAQESENVKLQQETKIQQLEKKLAAASSEHVTVFKTHYESVQSGINSMLGCIKRLQGDPEMSHKLSNALRALCQQTIGNLPSSATGEES